jgi:Mg2+/Co2+ transporter CorC
MKPKNAREILSVLKQSETDRRESQSASMEAHFDLSDRAIAQTAQLKLLNEKDPVTEIGSVLLEAAKSANPK